MVNRSGKTRIPVAGVEVASLVEQDPIQVSCGPHGCVANCCTNGTPIVLNPYEIMMICRESNLSYEELLDIVESGRVNGFPLVMLPRFPACHFRTGTGCSIYRARPLACRLFPLGRVFHDGQSSFVLPEQNVCTGIVKAPTGTVDEYLKDQDAALFIEMADQWIAFVSDMERFGLADKPVTSVVFHMLVYSPDTSPLAGDLHAGISPEELFRLRLDIAREQIPRYLNPA